MVWGALTIIIGVSTLALGLRGCVAGGVGERQTGGFAAGVTAAAFTVLALIAILWGAGHMAIGALVAAAPALVAAGRHPARIVDLLLLPYGTAVGIYALWILLREDAKRLFETPLAHGPSPA